MTTPLEEEVLTIELIATNPNIRSGRPIIKGTTIMVEDIAVDSIYHQQTPVEIAESLRLTLPQVHAALAYYYLHKEEIDASIKRGMELIQAYKEQRIGSRHKPLFG